MNLAFLPADAGGYGECQFALYLPRKRMAVVLSDRAAQRTEAAVYRLDLAICPDFVAIAVNPCAICANEGRSRIGRNNQQCGTEERGRDTCQQKHFPFHFKVLSCCPIGNWAVVNGRLWRRKAPRGAESQGLLSFQGNAQAGEV